MAHTWNAAAYDQLPLPHVAWGERVLDRIRVGPGDLVLDAGCGTGRDLASLLTRHPEVSAIGVDSSASMLQQASDRLAPFGDRVRLVHSDLTKPLGVTVDVVMSVAAFHWIDDHDTLFANLAAAMRPGARLTTDCGGAGNIASVEAAVIQVRGESSSFRHYADARTTAERLDAAGFDVESVALRPDPLRLDDPGLLSRYLATICVGPELATIPVEQHQDFVDAVRQAMPEPVVDYVRLEIDAIRR